MLKYLRPLAAGLVLFGLAVPVIGAWLSPMHWTLDFAGIFLKPALIGMALVLLAAVILTLRRPSRFRTAAASLALVSVLAAAPLLPAEDKGPGQQGSPAPITIYQHNVLADNLDGTAIAAQVRELDPDIAVFQEISQFYGVGPDLDALSDTWPHEVRDAPRPARQARVRILSKFPVLESEIARDATGLAIATARLEAPDGPLTVIGVHFTRPWPFDWPMKQVEQLAVLQETLEDADCPCVLVGDFNSTPWGRLARTLRAENSLHTLGLGWRGTWHKALPGWIAIPIDLSFASEDLAFGQFSVLPAAGSDHHAVMFEITPAPATTGS